PQLHKVGEGYAAAHQNAAARLRIAAAARIQAQQGVKISERAVTRTVKQLYERMTCGPICKTQRWPHTLLLSAFTPKGYITRFDSILALCPKLFLLEDPTGMAAARILRGLATRLRAAEIPHIACPDPLLPRTLQGILLPGCNCAVLNVAEAPAKADTTTIFCDVHTGGDCPEWMAMAGEHIGSACESLARALKQHDEIEEIYNSAMDWKGVTAEGQKSLELVLNLRERFLEGK
ncbi:MAG: hypothetical protein FWD16_07735, partial [Clostridia bacterium]|nr:hypothetical protein [Clostridia bacterium]